jgi:hypothetical protein
MLRNSVAQGLEQRRRISSLGEISEQCKINVTQNQLLEKFELRVSAANVSVFIAQSYSLVSLQDLLPNKKARSNEFKRHRMKCHLVIYCSVYE